MFVAQYSKYIKATGKFCIMQSISQFANGIRIKLNRNILAEKTEKNLPERRVKSQRQKEGEIITGTHASSPRY